MERRKFTREFKLEAVRLIKERGVSYVQASQDLGVHVSQLRDWVKKFSQPRRQARQASDRDRGLWLSLVPSRRAGFFTSAHRHRPASKVARLWLIDRDSAPLAFPPILRGHEGIVLKLFS